MPRVWTTKPPAIWLKPTASYKYVNGKAVKVRTRSRTGESQTDEK